MLPIWLGLAIYVAILVLLPVSAWFVLRRQLHPWVRAIALALLFFIACPAYGLLVFTDEMWPPDLLPYNYPRITTSTLGYDFTYEQHYGGDYYETFFRIKRDDGKTAFVFIDFDADRCWDMVTQERERKLYFVCRDTKPDSLVPYIDLEQRTLFTGLTRDTVAVDKLTFR